MSNTLAVVIIRFNEDDTFWFFFDLLVLIAKLERGEWSIKVIDLHSLAVNRSRPEVIGIIPASKSKLWMGVERNAPIAVLTAEYRIVFSLFKVDFGEYPNRYRP